MNYRRSFSLPPPRPSRDAPSDVRNHYFRVLQRNADDNDAQYGGAALAEFLGSLSDEQTPLSVPTNPAPPLRLSRKEVDRFMYSLDRTDVSSLAKADKLCDICFLCFGEWRWEDRRPANAGDSEPFKVRVNMMPENAVRLSCGHLFGELCLRTWMMRNRKGPLTCPKCRAKLGIVGGVKKSDT